MSGYTGTYAQWALSEVNSKAVHLPEGAVLSQQMFEDCPNLNTLWVGANTRTEGLIDLTGAAAITANYM